MPNLIPNLPPAQINQYGVRQPPSTIFENLPKPWQNLETKIVYIGVDGSYWDLNGNWAGRQGLTLAPKMSGFMHAPFNSLFSEGPYQIGAFYERTDFKKRLINWGVMVHTRFEPASSWQYRRLEQAWWRAWSPKQDGFLGCYTRTHGWRWLRVRLAEEPKTPFEIDPTAFDNNFMQWDMVIVAAQPFWTKKMLTAQWVNTADTATPLASLQDIIQNLINQFLGDVLLGMGGPLQPGIDVGEGYLRLMNNGDQEAWPKFLVSSPGRAWIQDGANGPMIPLPVLSDSDGYCLVDTDPMARTLTCATDPVDPLFYQVVRNSQLLNVLLHDLAVSTLPVWRRFTYDFTTPTPPETLQTIKVYHSNHDGTITGFMPQHFDKAYG